MMNKRAKKHHHRFCRRVLVSFLLPVIVAPDNLESLRDSLVNKLVEFLLYRAECELGAILVVQLNPFVRIRVFISAFLSRQVIRVQLLRRCKWQTSWISHWLPVDADSGVQAFYVRRRRKQFILHLHVFMPRKPARVASLEISGRNLRRLDSI